MGGDSDITRSGTFCSIIVRSYKRPKALLELLPRLLRQTHRDFELVILDQSSDPALTAAVAALGDPRIRLILRPPLGAAGARNEAIRHARGEILAFIDDDDLPVDDRWLAQHVDNYRDPHVMGVVGRIVGHPTKIRRVRFPRLVRMLALTHTWFRDTREYAYGPLRKRGIDYLHGTNSSCRRELCERVGGWDESRFPYGEEQSFAFRFARRRGAGEHLVYDPVPSVERRFDIPGGCDRRAGTDWSERELAARIHFYHAMVGHYFPWRFRLFYPAYLIRMVAAMVEWIWHRDNRHHTLVDRAWATMGLITRVPTLLWRHGWKRDPTAVRRVLLLEGVRGP